MPKPRHKKRFAPIVDHPRGKIFTRKIVASPLTNISTRLGVLWEWLYVKGTLLVSSLLCRCRLNTDCRSFLFSICPACWRACVLRNSWISSNRFSFPSNIWKGRHRERFRCLEIVKRQEKVNFDELATRVSRPRRQQSLQDKWHYLDRPAKSLCLRKSTGQKFTYRGKIHIMQNTEKKIIINWGGRKRRNNGSLESYGKKNSPYSELPGHGELSARILRQAPLPLQTETQTKHFIRDYSVHVID